MLRGRCAWANPANGVALPASNKEEGGEGGLCWPTDWSCARDCCLKTAQNGAHISKRLSGMPGLVATAEQKSQSDSVGTVFGI